MSENFEEIYFTIQDLCDNDEFSEVPQLLWQAYKTAEPEDCVKMLDLLQTFIECEIRFAEVYWSKNCEKFAAKILNLAVRYGADFNFFDNKITLAKAFAYSKWPYYKGEFSSEFMKFADKDLAVSGKFFYDYGAKFEYAMAVAYYFAIQTRVGIGIEILGYSSLVELCRKTLEEIDFEFSSALMAGVEDEEIFDILEEEMDALKIQQMYARVNLLWFAAKNCFESESEALSQEILEDYELSGDLEEWQIDVIRNLSLGRPGYELVQKFENAFPLI